LVTFVLKPKVHRGKFLIVNILTVQVKHYKPSKSPRVGVYASRNLMH
jgi:hypothetical protein